MKPDWPDLNITHHCLRLPAWIWWLQKMKKWLEAVAHHGTWRCLVPKRASFLLIRLRRIQTGVNLCSGELDRKLKAPYGVIGTSAAVRLQGGGAIWIPFTYQNNLALRRGEGLRGWGIKALWKVIGCVPRDCYDFSVMPWNSILASCILLNSMAQFIQPGYFIHLCFWTEKAPMAWSLDNTTNDK